MKAGLIIFLLVLSVSSVHAQNTRKSSASQITQTEPEIVSTTPDSVATDSLVEKIEKLDKKISQLAERMNSTEALRKDEVSETQRRLMLSLEILSRAEERAENLRKKIFELTEKENDSKLKLEQLEFESSEEMINRSVAIAGGLRPEVLREQRRQTLQAQKSTITNLISQIQLHKAKLEENLLKQTL